MLYSLLKYYRYIGAGDWSVMWNLTQHPPYPGIENRKDRRYQSLVKENIISVGKVDSRVEKYNARSK